VLFTRVTFDEGTDRRAAELWLAHLDANGAVIDKRLLVGRDQSPGSASFSPDGTRVAFIGSHIGKPTLFVMALAEGVARPLPLADMAPLEIAWSPDGTRIGIVGEVPGLPQVITGLPERPKGAERAPDPKVITDLYWRTDAGGERKPGSSHLFVVDAASGTFTRLTSGKTDTIDVGGIDWMPDGRFIIGVRTVDPINRPGETDLWRFDARTPDAAPVQMTSRAGSEENPKVSPDGKYLAFVGAETTPQFYPMPEAWLMPLAPGGAVRKAAPRLDRPVETIGWREDSQGLAMLFSDAGVTRVGEASVASGDVAIKVPLVGGTRLYLPSSGGDFSARGGTYAYTSAFTDRPAGLGISKGAAETGAVDFNAGWAATKRPGRIEEVRAKSRADGREIQGWVVYPPDFSAGKRYPLILDIHGGPNTDYGPFFSVTHALYAAAGYVVLYTNPRGSIGYGSEFANLITNAYPGLDHDDLMSMVDALGLRPYVDSRNLFIGGGSGGGVLTLNAIGREPAKFRGAVALRPVTDWSNQATTSDFPAFFMKQWMGVAPWEDPERYRVRSPFFLAGKIRTPTMLITGEEDFRTPISQTEMMFGALKLQGVETVMVRLPGAGHAMGRPSQWLQSVLAPIQFFDRLQQK
jgi:dipeptidyl aminopeptidase/acylaminoacyl peptidase